MNDPEIWDQHHAVFTRFTIYDAEKDKEDDRRFAAVQEYARMNDAIEKLEESWKELKEKFDA